MYQMIIKEKMNQNVVLEKWDKQITLNEQMFYFKKK